MDESNKSRYDEPDLNKSQKTRPKTPTESKVWVYVVGYRSIVQNFHINNSLHLTHSTQYDIVFSKLSTNKNKFVGLFVAFIHPNQKVPKTYENLKFGFGNS